MEIETNYKSYFWQSLIICILIFGIGIYLGYFIEAHRVEKILTLYQQSELNMLDINIQNSLLNSKNFQCENGFEEIIDFADRIYREALLLEEYEGANKFTEGIIIQHKKYDLLRAMLFVQALKLKETCGKKLTTVVYFYQYQPQDLEIKSKQNVISKKLMEFKEEQGNKIILIPIAGNLNLTSIEILKDYYDIKELPTVLINEKTKITKIEELSGLERYID